MTRSVKTFLFAALVIALAACADPKSKDGKKLDTPTTGEITVMVDEGYQSIIASSIDVFDTVYRQASIKAIYTSEGDAINQLLKDSIQVIVIPRKLTDDEVNTYYKPRGFEPAMTPIAHDAIAFILNPDNKDTLLTHDQLVSIFKGEIASWKDINPASRGGNINIVFDNPLSGTVRYVRDSIARIEKLPPNASALNTNSEVIDYVSKNISALGIINANVISDTDDDGVQSFLEQIKLLDVAKEEEEEGYGPYQAYIAQAKYPYTRTVYVINAQPRKGLGLGFASFMAGPSGQLIIHKDGMLPANAITRLIKVER